MKFYDTVHLLLTSRLKKRKKYIRSNNCSFMTKELRKAIVSRSELRNKFLKTRSKESKRHINRQINFLLACSAKPKDDFLETRP